MNLRQSGFLLGWSWLGLSCFAPALYGQPNRIPARIDNAQVFALRGHIHPKARLAFDRGQVESSFAMRAMTLFLSPSGDLEQLVARQQDSSSGIYHQWLTPEQFADRFGASQVDADQIVQWLTSQGFTVDGVARGRTWIVFSGNAGQTAAAFHTQIHHYLVDGEAHYANATEPYIPAALAGIVSSMRGLHDFRLKPHYRAPTADMTTSGFHSLAPDDFAAIYNVAPLYAAGIDGTGQKVAIAGQTAIQVSDLQTFRTRFGLPALNLQQVLVPGHANPGISPGDLLEANLDLEWSGAVARNATIVYVYSEDVFASISYIIDQNLAPVVSMSYGVCEAADLVDVPILHAEALRANAQGMTWINSAGDSGAGDCEDRSSVIAQAGPGVDFPASIPEITAMGGSEFNEQGGSYWNTTNTATGASVRSYIPEKVWNDTAGGGFAAGGGGVSAYFARPVWQTGPGVPDGAFRLLPDISLSASANHDPYAINSGGSTSLVGGTSAGAPAMAGIVALLNQYLVSTGVQKQPGVGNINPTLYRLAQNALGVFHDITVGDNAVPCAAGSPGCFGNTFGQAAGPGYDPASGLGSPDVFNLVHQWSNQPPQRSAVVPSVEQIPVYQHLPDKNGNLWSFTLRLTEEAGMTTSVTRLSIDGKDYDVKSTFGTAVIPGGGFIASANLGFAVLTVPKNVVFEFGGIDASGLTWSQQFSVAFRGPQVPLTVGGASNAASGEQTYAPGMLLSVYGTQLGDYAQSAAAIPLPKYLAGFEAWVNHVLAPLYYVAPGQVNIQIPYETQPGLATLTVGNPYINVDYPIRVNAVAPGIFASNGFVSAPFSSAGQGQATTLFLTGEGQVSPRLATGTTPSPLTVLSALPKPVQGVTVTVGGVPANVLFLGIPYGLVGVTQINYEVPPSVPVGVQPVIVKVGTVSSPSVNLNVTK